MEWIAGIDEAGRGPVLGSMVVCAYAVPRPKNEELAATGVKDSKQLSRKKREELAPELMKMGKHVLVESTAAELNVSMKRLSLNDIEAQKMAQALSELEKNVSGTVTQVYIDTPDPVLSTFERRLRRYYHGTAELVLSHKADRKFPVVSAASVLAKVTRDTLVDRISLEIGESVGTGYSHDERTITLLRRLWKEKDHPVQKYVRREWSTAKNLSVSQFKLDKFV